MILEEAQKSKKIFDTTMTLVYNALVAVNSHDQDRASEINNVGFSKFDGDIARDLIASGQKWGWTEKQYEFAKKLANKYRRQVAANGLDVQKMLAEKPHVPEPTKETTPEKQASQNVKLYLPTKPEVHGNAYYIGGTHVGKSLVKIIGTDENDRYVVEVPDWIVQRNNLQHLAIPPKRRPKAMDIEDTLEESAEDKSKQIAQRFGWAYAGEAQDRKSDVYLLPKRQQYSINHRINIFRDGSWKHTDLRSVSRQSGNTVVDQGSDAASLNKHLNVWSKNSAKSSLETATTLYRFSLAQQPQAQPQQKQAPQQKQQKQAEQPAKTAAPQQKQAAPGKKTKHPRHRKEQPPADPKSPKDFFDRAIGYSDPEQLKQLHWFIENNILFFYDPNVDVDQEEDPQNPNTVHSLITWQRLDNNDLQQAHWQVTVQDIGKYLSQLGGKAVGKKAEDLKYDPIANQGDEINQLSIDDYRK